MAEVESSVRDKLVYSRVIAVSFVAELLKRRAWRERLYRIRAIHTLALAEYLATVQWACEYLALAESLQEPIDQFSTALRDSRVRQAEQVLTAVLQVHSGHVEERPFCIRCCADMP